jgi:hypothetical protein
MFLRSNLISIIREKYPTGLFEQEHRFVSAAKKILQSSSGEPTDEDILQLLNCFIDRNTEIDFARGSRLTNTVIAIFAGILRNKHEDAKISIEDVKFTYYILLYFNEKFTRNIPIHA